MRVRAARFYIEAMERDDKWGTPVFLPFELGEELRISEESNPVPGLLLGGFALVLIISRRYLNI